MIEIQTLKFPNHLYFWWFFDDFLGLGLVGGSGSECEWLEGILAADAGPDIANEVTDLCHSQTPPQFLIHLCVHSAKIYILMPIHKNYFASTSGEIYTSLHWRKNFRLKYCTVLDKSGKPTSAAVMNSETSPINPQSSKFAIFHNIRIFKYMVANFLLNCQSSKAPYHPCLTKANPSCPFCKNFDRPPVTGSIKNTQISICLCVCVCVGGARPSTFCDLPIDFICTKT